MPEKTISDNMDYLVWKVARGWKQNNVTESEEYYRRRDFELSVIKQMNFCDYFLIIADIVGWAKSQGIPTGPGRGSGAGSLICYALGITTIDPIRFELFFERFLNPSRISMPDLDLDFCTERRSEIVKYIEAKYGSERVANIITFNKMKARAAIKDASRAVQISNYVVESDKIAKMIPLMSEDIKEAIEGSEELKQYAVKYPEMFAAANALLGKPKSVSVHAAGVVITPDRLVDYFPLYYSAKEKHAKNYASITQWDMYDMDECGFLKVDILGLNTLTIIDRTVKSVNARHGTSLEIEKVDLEDPRVLDLFARGNTTGLFQLERRYVQQFCRSMGIRTFRDVVDMNAIIRPGTMDAGMTKEFIERKNGRKDIEYVHRELEPVLNSTQGILVYQEQCCTGDTIVSTVDGPKRIDDIVTDKIVTKAYCVNNDGDVVARDILQYHDNGEKEVFEIELDNGMILKCTENHGLLTQRGWVQLKDITESDNIITTEDISIY